MVEMHQEVYPGGNRQAVNRLDDVNLKTVERNEEVERAAEA